MLLNGVRLFLYYSRCIVLTCLFLPACYHNEARVESINKQQDLSKAALYNVQLGLEYLRQGDRERAKQKLLTAREQEPGSPDVNAALAYYFEQTGEIKEARKLYLAALSLSGSSGSQLNNYGAFLCRLGEYKEAELYFLKAVRDMNYLHTAGAWENAGLCALAIPEYVKAKIYFSKALRQDPSRKVSLYELVKLESNMGNNLEALGYLQKYPDLVLNDKEFLSLAGDVARKAGV